MHKEFKTPAQLKSLIDDYFIKWSKANLYDLVIPSFTDLSSTVGLTVDGFKGLKDDPRYKKISSAAMNRVETTLAKWSRTKDEVIEDIMGELVTNFDWLPLDDEDRKLIQRHLN